MPRILEPNMKKMDKLARKCVCEFFGLQANMNRPVKIVDGSDQPKRLGKDSHWINGRGDIVHYPSAYRRKYGKPTYVCSTVSYTIGRLWLEAWIKAPPGEPYNIVSDFAQDTEAELNDRLREEFHHGSQGYRRTGHRRL
jgi:hypothetical protein